MEPAPLIDSALTVIFFDNDSENGQHPKPFQEFFISEDLDIAFAEAEAHSCVDLDISLGRVVNSRIRRSTSTACELFEVAQAVNRLRQSRGIKYLIPSEVLGYLKQTIQSLSAHKRKYDELLDQTEQKERKRVQAKRVSEMVGREERVRRRDVFRVMESQLHGKTRELAAAQDSLQREQGHVKRLEQSLECQICHKGQWDTVTSCGHLFSADCIKQWLEVNSAWVEDDEGYLVFREARYPICRVALSEEDLKRVYV